LEAFKKDKSMPYMHIGIRYGWEPEAAATGDLYIVKNRLPPSEEGKLIEAHISEEEIRDGIVPPSALATWTQEDWGEMKREELGPFGCCDCCHRRGCNCGAGFPHGSFTNYMYLSPQWCNSLMRLGYATSVDVVDAVTATEQ